MRRGNFKDWINNGFFPPTPVEIENLLKLLKDQSIQMVGISLRASPYFQVASQLTRIIQEKIDDGTSDECVVDAEIVEPVGDHA